jgi:hypothetical protein
MRRIWAGEGGEGGAGIPRNPRRGQVAVAPPSDPQWRGRIGG